MPTPKRQSIVDALIARLQGIDGTGSYNFDLSSKVHQWRDLEAQPWIESELPAVNVLDGQETTQQRVSLRHDHLLTIEIHGAVANLADLPGKARQLLGDLILAVGLDRQWSGLAQDTDPKENAVGLFQKGKAIVACRLVFLIKYRTNSFDPYNG